MKNIKRFLFVWTLAVVMLLSACSGGNKTEESSSIVSSNTVSEDNTSVGEDHGTSVDDVPEFDGETAYIPINNNIPDFKKADLVTTSYEKYSELDSLGRCGVTMACIGVDIMPTEERGSIGQVKPTGWHTVKYDNVDGKYLYNRCHLIGYQLTGENANERNLITGTRYLNIEGMLPFENMIADYVKETKNHVIYRVTPIFDGDNLLSRGVQMEAISVEDNGEGICFNVYAYNAQPGINIDYATGESVLIGEEVNRPETDETVKEYVLNTNSKKIHLPDCKSVKDISEQNKSVVNTTKSKLINNGYVGCKNCNP